MRIRVPGAPTIANYGPLPLLDDQQFQIASNFTGVGNGAPTLGRLCLEPYFTGPYGGLVEAIGVATTVAAGAGGIVRFGLYNAGSRAPGGGIFAFGPTTVLFDPGVALATDGATGNLLVTGLSIRLAPNRLIWLAALFSVAAPTARITAGVTAILGFNNALSGPAVSQILNGQNAAVALPDLSAAVFNGPSNVLADGPLVFLRFSA